MAVSSVKPNRAAVQGAGFTANYYDVGTSNEYWIANPARIAGLGKSLGGASRLRRQRLDTKGGSQVDCDRRMGYQAQGKKTIKPLRSGRS